MNVHVTNTDERNFYDGNGHTNVSLGKFAFVISATLTLQIVRLLCSSWNSRGKFSMWMLQMFSQCDPTESVLCPSLRLVTRGRKESDVFSIKVGEIARDLE